MIAWADPVGVLCDLIETSNGTLDATTVRERSNAEIEFLSSIGAVTAAELSSVVTCRVCDNDHIARLEFDPATRRHWYFCPEAGRVMVKDNDIATIRADPEWLVDWLVTALPITPPVRQRVLLPHRAWRLGKIHVGGSELTVVFALWMSLRRNLDELAAALATVPPVGLGLVLTTSGPLPRWLTLPHGYRLIELREIIRPKEDNLVIDRPRLLGWIKGLRKGLDRPARLILPKVDQRTLTGQIQAEIASRHLDRNPPAIKTIERHLSRMSKAKFGGL